MSEQPKPNRTLERDLQHFYAMAQETANHPALFAEHQLWTALAAEVEAYLRPGDAGPSLCDDAP